MAESSGLSSRLKRLVFWQITLSPTYAFSVLLLLGAASVESARLGPYTTWYNQRLKARAVEAGLIGGSETRVQDVLGPADDIMRSWSVLDSAGRPVEGARFTTSYNYYPYPLLPMSMFQVHCSGGVVRGLEMFDD